MLKAKAKPEVSLADRIRQARAEADAFIDAKAAEVKASKDGCGLPFPVIRQMLTKGASCSCRAALRLIEEGK